MSDLSSSLECFRQLIRNVTLPAWGESLNFRSMIFIAPVAAVVGWYNYRNWNQKKGGNISSENRSLEGVDRTSSSKTDSEKEPAEVATAHRIAGNDHFREGRFNEAMECYTEAIKSLKAAQAIIYQNRAAAFEQLQKYDDALADCNQAVSLDREYVKALQRRARILELKGDLRRSFEDISDACVLDNLRNQTTLVEADKIILKLSELLAKERWAKREPSQPSKFSVGVFLASFCNAETMSYLNVDESVDSDFSRACVALKEGRFGEATDACTAAIDAGGEDRHKARLLRGTLSYLGGAFSDALSDFDEVITDEKSDVQLRVTAHLVRGIMHTLQEKHEESKEDFAAAEALEPANPDVNYHRGRLLLAMGDAHGAARELRRNLSLTPDFAQAHAILCCCEHKLAVMAGNQLQIQQAKTEFTRVMNKFPHCAQLKYMFACILLEENRYKMADIYLKQAALVDPYSARYFIHRGLLQLDWGQDTEEATALFNQALDIDPQCGIAYEHLGMLELQKGNLRKAAELLNKAITLAPTERKAALLYAVLLSEILVAKQMGIETVNVEGLQIQCPTPPDRMLPNKANHVVAMKLSDSD